MRQGFAVLTLSLSIMIFGLAVARGIPAWIRQQERATAATAVTYLQSVQRAQERHQKRFGEFSRSLDELDLEHSEPLYFTVGAMETNRENAKRDTWTLTLTRAGNSIASGVYTVTFTQNGFQPNKSSIHADFCPRSAFRVSGD